MKKLISLCALLGCFSAFAASDLENYRCVVRSLLSPRGEPLKVSVSQSSQGVEQVSFTTLVSGYYPGCGQMPTYSYQYIATMDASATLTLDISIFDTHQTLVKQLSKGIFHRLPGDTLAFEFSRAKATYFPTSDEQCKPSWDTLKWDARYLSEVSECEKL